MLTADSPLDEPSYVPGMELFPDTSRWDLLRCNSLQWIPGIGIGFFPVVTRPYDLDYWHHYRELDQTASGDALTAMRIALVAKYWSGAVVDVGIGGGKFVAERPYTRGFDVNPNAIDWLKDQGAWCDINSEQVDAACFFDSLEHIHDPGSLLANVRRWAFVSLPIFAGPEHVLRSKHYKPEEHVWYFQERGLRTFMERLGWACIEVNDDETKAGREGIKSFVFRRS